MRRDSRRREKKEKNMNVLYIGGSILAIGLLAFAITFVVYGNKMDKQAQLDNQKIASLVQESASKTQEASSQMGKTVEESQNEIQNTTNTETQKTNTVSKETDNKNTQTEKVVKKEEVTKTNNTQKEIKSEENKSQVLTFIKPVDGEIVKDYAKDKLVYSETLEEWTTHLGWDIKAVKTTVVKSASDRKSKIN